MLEEFGLTRNESKVYLALLKLKQSKITDISSKSDLHTKNVYDSLDKLMKKGLVSSVIERNQKIFIAENPEKLKSMIQEKSQRLDSILPSLLNMYSFIADSKNVSTFYGKEALRKRLSDIEESKTKVVRVFAPTELGFLDSNRFKSHILNLRRILRSNKKEIQLIETDTIKSRKNAKNFDKGWKGTVKRKFYPFKKNNMINWTVSGDLFSICIFDEEMLYIRIKSKIVAESFREYFDALWSNIK